MQRALDLATSFSCLSSTAVTKKTPLYDLHVKYGGDLTDFCGYWLPIKYANSDISVEHHNTRKKATIFDVSHMGQFKITGESRDEFLETLILADVKGLPAWDTKLSCFTNFLGGIRDDMMVTKTPNYLYLVVNAACKEKDWGHLKEHMDHWNKIHGTNLRMEDLSHRGLLALQGPMAMKVLSKFTDADLTRQAFMSQQVANIDGVECFISRCGYTGEDGFEISIPREHAMRVAECLLSDPAVTPAGLGCRDSLRLEAGLCLYGHEIDDATTPIEGGLAWFLNARRREQGGFLGAKVILDQFNGERPLRCMRTGLLIKAGAPAREQTPVFLAKDTKGLKQIGEIRSGLFAPSLGKSVAQAWMLPQFSKKGTELLVKVRGRMQPAVVTPMPFLKKPFYRVPKELLPKKEN